MRKRGLGIVSVAILSVGGLIVLAGGLWLFSSKMPDTPSVSANEPRVRAVIELGDPRNFIVNDPRARPAHNSFFDVTDRPASVNAAKAAACAVAGSHPDTAPTPLHHGGSVVISETAGECFYEIIWNQGDGQVAYRQGSDHLYFDPVFSVMGSADPADGMGISEWDFTFSWKKSKSWDDVLSQLRAADWKRYIQPDAPRLSGHDAYRYGLRTKAHDDPSFNAFEHDDFTGHDFYSLDSATPPTDDERRRFYSTQWQFYKGDVYITVGDPWDVRIQSADAFYRDWFSNPEDKAHWRALLPGELARYAAQRQAIETKLRNAGYVIDESYEAPAIEREKLGHP